MAQVAIRNNLTQLAGALTAANKLAALSDPAFEGTVFAPTNEAFTTALAALGGAGASANLTALLPALLDFHVVPGNVLTSQQLANGSALTTAT